MTRERLKIDSLNIPILGQHKPSFLIFQFCLLCLSVREGSYPGIHCEASVGAELVALLIFGPASPSYFETGFLCAALAVLELAL